MLNCALNTLPISEIEKLKGNGYYLRSVAYMDDENNSYFNCIVLDMEGCNSDEYGKIITSAGHQSDYFVPFPCVIYIGPFWYLFQANKDILKTKDVTPEDLYLYSRDALPHEDTEEKIRVSEWTEGIFIVRN